MHEIIANMKENTRPILIVDEKLFLKNFSEIDNKKVK
jgi:hypothetical protein